MTKIGAAIAVAAIACGGHVGAAPPAQPAQPAQPPASATEPADDTEGSPEDPSDALPVVAHAAPSGAPRAALLAEAQRQLRDHRESHYVHHTRVDEASGVFDYDCSGFVGYALSRAAPDALAAVISATRPRPLAADFEAFFASLESPRGAWSRVARASDLLPGDLIAWREPPVKRSRNTGHVMIAASAPRPSARPNELVVDVIDSSHSGHGRADARIRDHENGIGTGSIILLVDDAGKPIGYRWSLSRISIAYATDVALGRLP